MANVQNRIILSSLVFVFVALSACSKHGARNQIVDDKKAPATSTAADPAKAVADNKKADDAAKAAAAEAAKAGEKPATDPADADAAASDRGEALDKVVSLFANDKDKKAPTVDAATVSGETAAGTTTAAAAANDVKSAPTAGEVAAATTATAAAVQAKLTPIVSDAKVIANGTATSIPTDSSTATAEDAEIAKPVVTAETAVATTSADSSKDPIQLPAVTVTGAGRATRLAFVKAMIQPTMELNNAIARQQLVIANLKKNAAAKPLSEADAKLLTDLKEQYGLQGSATFEDLLARVDMVSTPFLIAKFAHDNGWKAEPVTLAMLGERVKFLNTSSAPEAAAYRAARIAVKPYPAQFRSWAIMKGVEQRSADPEMLPDVVLDINELSKDPSIAQEIARVRAVLEAQIPTP